MYVYPALMGEQKVLTTTDNFPIEEKLVGLLKYLKDNDKIEDISQADSSIMHIYSDNVLNMIKNGEKGWEELVPEKVADSIKKMELFHYKPALV